MEVLYHIFGHILWGYSLKFRPSTRPYIWCRYLQSIGSWNGHWLVKPGDFRWCEITFLGIQKGEHHPGIIRSAPNFDEPLAGAPVKNRVISDWSPKPIERNRTSIQSLVECSIGSIYIYYGSMIYPFKKRFFSFCMEYHGIIFCLLRSLHIHSVLPPPQFEAWKSCDGRGIWSKTCCSIGPWPMPVAAQGTKLGAAEL